jgi:hypothetical protein
VSGRQPNSTDGLHGGKIYLGGAQPVYLPPTPFLRLSPFLCQLPPRVWVLQSTVQEVLLEFSGWHTSLPVVTAVGRAASGDEHPHQKVGAFFSPYPFPLIFLCWVLFQNHYSF